MMQPMDHLGRQVAAPPSEKVINPVAWNNDRLVDGEIDLFELLNDLVQQKLWLIGSVLACLLLAIGYLSLVTPTYKVDAAIYAATSQDLAPLNMPGMDYHLSSGAALSKVTAQLSSYQSRLAYWQGSESVFGEMLQTDGGLSVPQQLGRFDAKNFHLSLPDPDAKKADDSVEAKFVRFSLDYPASLDGVALASGLLQYALMSAREQVEIDWKVSRQAQLDSLLYQLQTKRTAYSGNVVSREARLVEAIVVARSLGIKKPTTLGDFAQGRQESSGSVVRMEVNNNNLPLYFMGTEALQSELDTLRARIGDGKQEVSGDPLADQPQDRFIDGLAEIKGKARYLESLNPDFSTLKLAQVTREPAPPYEPVSPKKVLVLAVALLLGLMLGCMLALLRAAWLKRQQPA